MTLRNIRKRQPTLGLEAESRPRSRDDEKCMFWVREVENEPSPKTQVRVSQQVAVTDCRGAEASLREVVDGLEATQKVLTDNMALQQTTMAQIMNQQRELLAAVSQQHGRREPYNNSNNNSVAVSLTATAITTPSP